MPQRFLLVASLVLCFGLLAGRTIAAEPSNKRELPPIPLSIDEIHAWIDRTHPLLKGAGTEKVMARGKMLKALGAFEPTVVNDTEIERFISSSDPGKGTQTGGFNDTGSSAPWGFRYMGRRQTSDRRCQDSGSLLQ
jgi:hypothetical protein